MKKLIALLLILVTCFTFVPACAGTTYVSGQAAADLGYVNPGTDRRIGGDIGARLGALQRDYSFRDSRPPVKVVEVRGDGTIVETATAPNGAQHTSIAIPRGDGRWDTYRFGYRYDPNWGDPNTVGVDPNPELPPGGYIYDVVIKLNQAQTYIEGYEHGRP